RATGQPGRLGRACADAGVPCQGRGAERFFDRPEVRQATGLLRTAARSARAEADGAGSAAPPAAGAEGVAEVRHILAGVGLTPGPPSGRGAARDRWESLAALAQLAEDHCAAVPGAGRAGTCAELGRPAPVAPRP